MRVPYGLLSCYYLFGYSAQPVLAHPKLIRRDADFESVKTRLDSTHQNKDEDEPNKYFHESVFHQHYDGRFADHPLAYGDRGKHLQALIHTYLTTMSDIGAETWIMHGSLLGWYWNRRILPWDSDLDTMVSETSMHHLADFYNMTVHRFTMPEDPEGVEREYLLEVNPHCRNGSLDEVNKIDARWIDMDTGLFIDITTLRRNTSESAQDDELMVKDRHHYVYDDIYPLRDSVFEGSPVKIPFAYAEVLIEEYGAKALSQMLFESHRFDSEKMEWVPLSCEYSRSCGHFRNPGNGVNLPTGARSKNPMLGKPRRRPPPMDPEEVGRQLLKHEKARQQALKGGLVRPLPGA